MIATVLSFCRGFSSLLRDEQGAWSTARCAFWLTLLVTLALVVATAFGWAALSPAAYSLLGIMFMALAGWAAGPRVMQYLGPQIGAVVQSLSRAKGDARWPNVRTDDERGDP